MPVTLTESVTRTRTVVCDLCGAESVTTAENGARPAWPAGWHTYRMVFSDEYSPEVTVCVGCAEKPIRALEGSILIAGYLAEHAADEHDADEDDEDD